MERETGGRTIVWAGLAPALLAPALIDSAENGGMMGERQSDMWMG
ncbi:MAG: hypothetical protein AAB296_06560 [Candidatus Desantisbacteria bacterium]